MFNWFIKSGIMFNWFIRLGIIINWVIRSGIMFKSIKLVIRHLAHHYEAISTGGHGFNTVLW